MRRLALAGLLLATAPTPAQEDLRIDTTRLYVTEPAACAAVEEKGVDAFMDMDFLSLTFAGGIQSMEFHCTFFDVKSREGSTYLFIDAICSAPGEVYPDTLAVTPFTETEIQVVSSFDITMTAAGIYQPADDTVVPGTTIYTRCDNLSEIPFD